MTKLSREELIEITDKLMHGRVADDRESNRLGRLFKENIGHPAGTDLIFYWHEEFESPEALVDFAQSDKKLRP